MAFFTIALWFVAAALPGTGAAAPFIGVSPVAVVADPGCPVLIERVALERTAEGIVLIYTIRNETNDPVKAIVLTAAAVDWTGAVKHVEMIPLQKPIARGATAEHRASFLSIELATASRVHVGVQAVQWKGKRHEWRGALKLNGPVALAARN